MSLSKPCKWVLRGNSFALRMRPNDAAEDRAIVHAYTLVKDSLSNRAVVGLGCEAVIQGISQKSDSHLPNQPISPVKVNHSV